MDFQKILLDKKIRPTSSRIKILDILQKASKPIDVLSLADRLKENKIQINHVTIYRNLEIFLKSDIIKQIDFRDGRYRYEIQHEHHHHLICKKCRRVIPIYEKCLAITDGEILKKYGFTMQEHHLEFFGVCSQCG